MIKANELRKGRTIIYNGELSVIHEVQHVAKGNKASYMQARVKNLKSGIINDVRFRVDERLEVPFVESKQYEYLYRDGENFVLMDLETYDQILVGPDLVGEGAKWLKPNERINCQIYDGSIVAFELPMVVALEITDTPPVVKGATATNQLKEATLETGARVRVPPFIEPGERVRIDTRTGEYIERDK